MARPCPIWSEVGSVESQTPAEPVSQYSRSRAHSLGSWGRGEPEAGDAMGRLVPGLQPRSRRARGRMRGGAPVSFGIARRAHTARVIVGAMVGVVFLVMSAPLAVAHTALKASSPRDGGRVGVAPGRLLLVFTEPMLVSGARVVVAGPGGGEYQGGAARVAGAELSVPLKPLGPAGVYRVSFRVVADDGHPLTSGMRFTLTRPGPAAGGARQPVGQDAPLAPVPVSSGSVNNAPVWAPWLAGLMAAAAIGGAVWFGRRTTRDLG
jgi:methionine-rich copper-binding protein CopC